MGDPDKKALQILRRVLAEYPKPVAIPAKTPGRSMHYVPAIKVAMHYYVTRFAKTKTEPAVKKAFAGVLPKVLDRCQRYITTTLNCIADRKTLPGYLYEEQKQLECELSDLAAVFVPPVNGKAGPYYKSVVNMITRLHELAA
jgi:hypothetical protein